MLLSRLRLKLNKIRYTSTTSTLLVESGDKKYEEMYESHHDNVKDSAPNEESSDEYKEIYEGHHKDDNIN
jgi:hypothetical protein